MKKLVYTLLYEGSAFDEKNTLVGKCARPVLRQEGRIMLTLGN